MDEIRFFVPGLPAPKGSKRVVTRDRYGNLLQKPLIIDEDNLSAGSGKSAAWAKAVEASAAEAMRGRQRWRKTALQATMICLMPRPATAKHKRWCDVKPDWDKVGRTTGDALERAGVYDNDSRIVDGRVLMPYITKGQPGAWLVIRPMPDQVYAELQRLGIV